MLTSSDDEEHLFEAVRAGASGYLLKDVPPEEVAVGIGSLRRAVAHLADDGIEASPSSRR